MSIGWEAAGGSDVGRLRKGNEDTLRLDHERGIFLVADGMGGHAAGEVASELAAETVGRAVAAAVDAGVAAETLDAALQSAFTRAHAAISECCRDSPQTRGMGTTLTACVIDRSGSVRVAHIGDSRLYRLREGVLEQITRDHTWIQREIDAGRLTPAAARSHPLSHIVTRVLSEDVDPEIDLTTLSVLPGDFLILCTDGLHNMLDDAAMVAAMASGTIPLSEAVTRLVDAANSSGGADNITVLLIRIVQD